jgi:predicted nucleic acid-binding Zn ribbon protein
MYCRYCDPIVGKGEMGRCCWTYQLEQRYQREERLIFVTLLTLFVVMIVLLVIARIHYKNLF